MAESAVSLVIEHLVPLLDAELKLLKGVRGEVKSIEAELRQIRPFLRDADERAERGETSSLGVAEFVRDVRGVSHRIEDVIDEYILHLQTQGPPGQRQSGFVGFLRKIACLTIKLKPRHQIASEIEDIKATIRHLQDLGDRYGLQLMQEGPSSSQKNVVKWNDPRIASLFLDDAELVGIKSPKEDLIRRMGKEVSSKRTVISVVGGGGLGKTTLVKKVYDDQIGTAKFDCHAWITVSESYKMEDVLKALIKQFYLTTKQDFSTQSQSQFQSQSQSEQANPCLPAPPTADIETTMQPDLITQLRDYLQQKRYVAVFDDVWDEVLWETIKLGLINNEQGSRIIITTRHASVASSCRESRFDYVKTLRPLSDRKARDLFCKKAFSNEEDGCCPEWLEELVGKIVKRCEGVPLAIVAVGGVLANKNQGEWQKFYDSLGSELESNPKLQPTMRILSLSYFHLPYFLKPCFLYFGVFPEDYPIRCVRLLRLWIAEGFVTEKRGKTLEETAQEFLTELIGRNLVQVLQVDFDGKARTCRVHDFLRELILSKFKELNFCQIMAGGQFSIDGQARRLSIHKNADSGVTEITGSRIRSVFVFQADGLPDCFSKIVSANFKLLKILDFEKAPINFLPEEVGNLIHLRYLSVRNTKVNRLPKSIGRLRFLLTLDLKKSLVRELPIEIKRLHKLRHLLAYDFEDPVPMPHNMPYNYAPMPHNMPYYYAPMPHNMPYNYAPMSYNYAPMTHNMPHQNAPMPHNMPYNYAPMSYNYAPMTHNMPHQCAPMPHHVPYNYAPMPYYYAPMPHQICGNREQQYSKCGLKIGEGFGCLEDLQKLYFVEANHGCEVIKELGKLRQLRKLGIIKLKGQDGKALCAALGKMSHLETLDVGWSDENETMDLRHLSSPPPRLQRLYLRGRLESFPKWISSLQNLVRIGFYGSGLTEDPLNYLQALPRLLEVGLYDGAYDGECLRFEAAGFPKLKFLTLDFLTRLNSVKMEEGSLPSLERVEIEACPRLNEIPQKLAAIQRVRHPYVPQMFSDENPNACAIM